MQLWKDAGASKSNSPEGGSIRAGRWHALAEYRIEACLREAELPFDYLKNVAISTNRTQNRGDEGALLRFVVTIAYNPEKVFSVSEMSDCQDEFTSEQSRPVLDN